MVVTKKVDLELKEMLSKDGPRIRTGGCERHGHKPKYFTYGFPPREVRKPNDQEKK